MLACREVHCTGWLCYNQAEVSNMYRTVKEQFMACAVPGPQLICAAPAADDLRSTKESLMSKLMHRRQWQTANLQEVLDDLVRDDVAHIICIGQLRKRNSSHFSLLQISKSWPSAVACTFATWF